MYALPVPEEYWSAPTMISEYPSPFTSPAEETLIPKKVFAVSPVIVISDMISPFIK